MNDDEIRLVLSTIGETFTHMREHFDAMKMEHNRLVESHNQAVQACEQALAEVALRLGDFEGRLRHLETGGVEAPPSEVTTRRA